MNRGAEAGEIAIAARPAGILRALWGCAGTILSVLYTIVLAPVAALVAFIDHGHLTGHVCRLWARLILLTCGVHAEIEGLENLDGLENYVLVSNHQSLFDILAVIRLLPLNIRFVAKKELAKIPLIGFTMRKAHHIVIDRRGGGQAIRRALEVVRYGYSICVFAEGTRHSDNRVHEFNDGAAWLAIATHLPCVPMAISGTAALMPRGAKLVVPGCRIRIRLGKPIEPCGLRSAGRAELTRQLEERVRELFTPAL
ncbi:MAG: lysophospholipid acyltransferase family protein [Candidatus Binataceae bacterium]